jgi:hypothetical protein
MPTDYIINRWHCTTNTALPCHITQPLAVFFKDATSVLPLAPFGLPINCVRLTMRTVAAVFWQRFYP